MKRWLWLCPLLFLQPLRQLWQGPEMALCLPFLVAAWSLTRTPCDTPWGRWDCASSLLAMGYRQSGGSLLVGLFAIARGRPLDLLLAALLGWLPAGPGPVLGAIFCHLAVEHFWPRPKDREEVRLVGVLRPFSWSKAVTGLAGLLMGVHPLAPLLLWPLLWAVQEGARNASYRIHAREASAALSELERVGRKKDELEALARRLSSKDPGRVAEWARQLSGQPSLRQAAEVLLNLASGWCPSTCVFLHHESGGVYPFVFRTPHRERAEAAMLMKWSEPLVNQCLAQQTPVRGRAGEIFQGESPALALPLGRLGVLYLGGTEASPELEHLARLGASALEAAREREMLSFESSRAGELKRRLELMELLLQGLKVVQGSLDGVEICQRALRVCQQLTGVSGARLRYPGLPEQHLGTPAEGTSIPVGEEGALVLAGNLPADQLVAVSLLAAHTALALANSQRHHQVVQQARLGAVGRLAAGFAHEINNPLMAISTQLAILEALVTGEDGRESLHEINLSLQRCRSVSYDLLAFSEPARPATRFALADVVERAVLQTGVQDTCQRELSPELAVTTSYHDLLLILLHLLGNARAVSARQRVAAAMERGQIWLEVADEGPGLDEEALKSIFEPFLTREAGRGSGLGLYVCFNTAKSLGGSLEVRSQPGQGARFRLWLPG